GANRLPGRDQVPDGKVDEPDAVSILRSAKVPIQPDTAYQVALHSGFVPTVGAASEHPAYADQPIVRLPPFKSASSFSPSTLSVTEPWVATPAGSIVTPVLDDPKFSDPSLPGAPDLRAAQLRPLTPPPDETLSVRSQSAESSEMSSLPEQTPLTPP